MRNDNYKKWLYSGLAIVVVSMLGAVIGVVWGMSSSFAALKTNESAGLGAVSSGIYTALIFNILFLVTGLIGIIVSVIGGIKGYRQSKAVK